MAVQAAQNTASAAGAVSAGTATVAAAAAAGSGGVVGTVASTVSGSSTTTQVVMALGAAAVVAGAVSAGVLAPRSRAIDETVPVPPTPFPSIAPSGTTFVEPCGVVPETEFGQIRLFYGGFDELLNESQQLLFEAGFVGLYNNLSSGCSDLHSKETSVGKHHQAVGGARRRRFTVRGCGMECISALYWLPSGVAVVRFSLVAGRNSIRKETSRWS